MRQRPFYIIAAMDDEQGLGKGGDLAWRLSADLKHFKNITTLTKNPSLKNVLIMGRKTWESLPDKSRPLSGRINVVLTHQQGYSVPDGVLVYNDLNTALDALKVMAVGEVFVIGGANLYAQAITHLSCKQLFITRVKGKYACDVFFPTIPGVFKLKKNASVMQENAVSYSFEEYSR